MHFIPPFINATISNIDNLQYDFPKMRGEGVLLFPSLRDISNPSPTHPVTQHFAHYTSAHSNSVLTFLNNTCYCLSSVKHFEKYEQCKHCKQWTQCKQYIAPCFLHLWWYLSWWKIKFTNVLFIKSRAIAFIISCIDRFWRWSWQSRV